MIYSKDQPLPIAVLISGQGSNLQAIIDAIAKGLPAKIQVVISNQPHAYGLERARKAGIATQVIPHQAFKNNREAYDAELLKCLEFYQPELILLAGFMRILSPSFIQNFPNRILNIHPSLLPKFPGLNTYEKALAAGETEHGATVHLVTEDLDAGPIVAQAKFKITAEDTVSTLKEKTQNLEHELYPEVVRLFAQGQLPLDGKKIKQITG